MFNKLLTLVSLCCALAYSNNLLAQAGSYSFAVSTGTYTPLGASATAVPDLLADFADKDIEIGFDFEFEGVLYDSVAATSDGFLSFVVGATTTSGNDLDGTSSARRPLVAPLWDDHDGNASSSAALYEVSGTAPNRVFTFEWRDWEWSWNSTDSVVSFQVKLYETSNVIEFTYRWESATSITSPDASIGISGATTFLSVTDINTGTPVASNSIENSSIDTIVTDQIFTFTPPACPILYGITNATNIGANAITVNWATAGSHEINWDVSGFTPGDPGSNTGTSATSSFAASGLLPGTWYDFYLRKDCGSGVYSAWSGPFTVSTAYAAPYLEDWSNGVPNDWTEAEGLIGDPTTFTSSSSAWSEDGFSNSGSTGSARINIYGTSRDEWLISPSIDLGTGSTNYELYFEAGLTPWASTASATMGADDTVKVIISTDNGLTWSDANSLLAITSTTTVSNGAGTPFSINLTGYTGVVKFAFYAESTASNVDNDFFVDNIEVRVPPACPPPSALMDSNITISSIDLGWQSSGSGPWYIYWGECGFNQASPSAALDTATVNYTTISGLSPNTGYEFYVFEDCGAAGFSDSLNTGCIYTLCDALNIPFAEGFNSTSTTQKCWEVLNANNDGDQWDLEYNSNPFEGDEVAMMYTDFNSGANDDWLISPGLILSNNERLKFQYRVQSSGEPNDFELLISTTGKNPADFTDTLVPLTPYSNTTYQQMTVDLSAYSGTVYLAWHVPAGGLDGWRLYIDEVIVEPIPACLMSTSLVVSAITSDAIQISWTPGGGVNFGIEYGPVGFTPGSGFMASTVDTFFTANGLSASTTYDFYVTDTCVAGNSTTLGPITIKTHCSPLIAPLLEDFDGVSWIIGSSSGFGDTIDACWSRNSETGYKWSAFNGTTASSNTGPDMDHTSGTGNFLYTESSSTSPSQAELISPLIDVSALNVPYVKFWYHRYGTISNMGDMHVDVNDGNGWVRLLTLTGTDQTSGADPFKEKGLDVSAFGDTIQVRFSAIAISCCSGDMAIDDFQVMEAPSCPPLSGLTASGIVDTSATFDWSAGTNAGSYEVWYGPQGFYQGTATLGGVKIIAPYDSLIVDTLSELTCYEFVVRGICGPGDTSTWAGPYSFCTPPSCPQPINLGDISSASTASSATVYWSSLASDHNVEFGLMGFTPGAGTMLNVTNDTVIITGLSASSCYEFYVRDSCGVGDVSIWSGPHSFGTVAGGVTFPVVEGFENGLVDFINKCENPTFWIQEQTIVHMGSNSAKLGYQANDSSILELAGIIDLTATSNPVLSFYHIAKLEGGWDEAYVEISTDGGATYTALPASAYQGNAANYATQLFFDEDDYSIWGTTAAPAQNSWWKKELFDLSSYKQDSVRIRFKIDADGSVQRDGWYLDDIRIEDPTCAAPSNLGVATSTITINSANVFWTAGGAGNFNVEYGTLGFSPGTGIIVNATNDTINLSGLLPGTQYQFYIRDSCGVGDVSTWAGPFTFLTAFTTNYLNDFNISGVPFAWSEMDGRLTANTQFTGSSSGWDTDDFGNVSANSPSQGVNIYSSGQYEWLISPSIYLDPSITNLQVEFDAAITAWPSSAQGYFNGSDDTLAVVISTDNGTTWSSTDIIWYADASDTIDATGEHIIVPLPGYTGYVKFGIYAGSVVDDSPDNDIFIDNFEVRIPAACVDPAGLTVTNVTTDSALVYWTPGDIAAIGWEVIYTLGNQPASSGTVVPGTNDSLFLTGLTDATSYCVYLVEQCSNGYSDTIGPICFNTMCLKQSLPYIETFSNDMGCFTAVDSTIDPSTWMWLSLYNGFDNLDGSPGFMMVDSDEAGSGIDMDEYAYSPEIDASALAPDDSLFITFEQYWRTYAFGGSEVGDVDVFDGTNWITVFSQNQATGDLGNWGAPDSVKINITAYAHADLQVRFHYYDANYDYWWAVDNFSVYKENFACPGPQSPAVNIAACDSVEISWTSGTATTSTTMEYGPAGYPPGTGTVVSGISSPYTLSGLALDTEYDVYLMDSCGTDFSMPVGPITFQTDSVGPVLASFTAVQTGATLVDGTVDVDATASTGDGLIYSWDFDNGSSGTGVTASATYTANGVFNIILTVTDRCGNTDDTTMVVTVSEISIVENKYNAEIQMYPNPSNGVFRVNVSNGITPYSIEVSDLSGKIIYRKDNIPTGTEQHIDLGNKASGVYLVRFIGEGLNVSQRLMVD